MTQHLAQCNIVRIRYPLDDPRIPAGHRPSMDEGVGRLDHLKAHGPSDHAFGWERIPAAQLWKTARCAETSGQAA